MPWRINKITHVSEAIRFWDTSHFDLFFPMLVWRDIPSDPGENLHHSTRLCWGPKISNKARIDFGHAPHQAFEAVKGASWVTSTYIVYIYIHIQHTHIYIYIHTHLYLYISLSTSLSLYIYKYLHHSTSISISIYLNHPISGYSILDSLNILKCSKFLLKIEKLGLFAFGLTTYIHTYITYIHTYIQTNIHTYIHTLHKITQHNITKHNMTQHNIT